MQLTRERVTLVQALSSMAVHARRSTARRFLEGLSTDELEYIAEYLGCRLLEPQLDALRSDRNGLAVNVERFQCSRRRPAAVARAMGGGSVAVRSGADVAHKMILLLEYLSMSELGEGRQVAWSEQGCA